MDDILLVVGYAWFYHCESNNLTKTVSVRTTGHEKKRITVYLTAKASKPFIVFKEGKYDVKAMNTNGVVRWSLHFLVMLRVKASYQQLAQSLLKAQGRGRRRGSILDV